MKTLADYIGHKLGFTGTREGMSPKQKEILEEICVNLKPSEFHHGDCFGADAQAHEIAVLFCPVTTTIHVHPPCVAKQRAFKKGAINHPEKPYAVRNQDIVNACDLLIAMPKSRDRTPHSGTWMTINMAWDAGKKALIIFPDGDTK